ncbi:MAG: right-handed parallel beta-helix repeat-containing protein [Prolixibacteraceae bacterium]|nr:right-handed parallel beta-helix repeat-containing protein [Prolixibacteraceae bacterium]
MKSEKKIIIWAKSILVTFILTGAFYPLVAQTTYFVSPKGNDKNIGSEMAPLKSIEEAQKKARANKGEVTIFLRGGEYRLNQPIVFSPEDGNVDKHLVLTSFPGEQAVISGGIQLKLTWQPYKNGIMQAKVSPKITIDMLIVDGKIRHMARYPNFDSTAIRFNGTSADATSPERVTTWKNPAGGFLHAMHVSDWGDFHYRISAKDEHGNLDLEGGWQNNRPYGLSKENRMVEHIFEELDAPEEWFYDTNEAILYYYPLPNEDIHKAIVEVAQLKHLIEFRGTAQKPVRNITIKNIEFTQTARTFMEHYEPLLRSDWTMYRGGTIVFEGTDNCQVSGCYLHNLGGNAVFFSNYNRNSAVTGSHITQIGASAICFVGDTNAVRSPLFNYHHSLPLALIDTMTGPKNNNYPAHCLVHDNLIHTIGLFEKQITGVELSMCKSITVSHNSIYDVPRAGINVSEGTWGGHIIEYNDVFDTVKETGDHGSFNSWGRDRFWHPNRDEMNRITANVPSLILADAIATVVIRNNRFRCDRGWDIDLDDGSSNYHIYNNLCLNGGIKLREGFYRVVENNILINNTFHPHVWFENSGDVFARNIVMEPYEPIQLLGWGAMVDYNIFTNPKALAEATNVGIDKHSIVYPVDFQYPDNGDFRVKNSTTDVFRMGFLNFDMDGFGVVSSHLKTLAKTPKINAPIINMEKSESNKIEWFGWRVKNLDTQGERSATGMDSERGVYVISMVDHYSKLKDFLRSNDVIIMINGLNVNNLGDLLQLFEQIDLTKPVEFIIYRNQSEVLLTVDGTTFQ